VRSTDEIIRLLTSRRGEGGWLTKEYARKRKFFTTANARAIESCWLAIREWSDRGLVTAAESALLLASLIDSADRVANTAGTYYAYLKAWHRKAVRPFQFRLLTPVRGTLRCESHEKDAHALVREVDADVLYLDPPYNQRSHAHYYHLPETMARSETPSVHGASGIPDTVAQTSAFNRPSLAADALADIIRDAKARVVVVHYATSGLVSERQIRTMLSPYKVRSRHVLTAPGYTTQRQPRRTPHIVYVAASRD